MDNNRNSQPNDMRASSGLVPSKQGGGRHGDSVHPARQLPHRAHELGRAEPVRHRVAEPEAHHEAAALERCHLHGAVRERERERERELGVANPRRSNAIPHNAAGINPRTRPVHVRVPGRVGSACSPPRG
jgi:hypothetical protein